MRVFLDTNVLVSAFATRGLCNELYEHVLHEHELSTGEVIIHELRRVLAGRMGGSPADLLEVAPQAPLPIMTPRNFWNMARGSPDI